MKYTINNTICDTWFERDRAYICLKDMNDETIIEYWDEDIEELIECGLLKSRNWHSSLVAYANYINN
jgi:hypothetical protein